MEIDTDKIDYAVLALLWLTLHNDIVAAISRGLQDAGEGLEMAFRMFLPPIARGKVERRRRRLSAERPAIPVMQTSA